MTYAEDLEIAQSTEVTKILEELANYAVHKRANTLGKMKIKLASTKIEILMISWKCKVTALRVR